MKRTLRYTMKQWNRFGIDMQEQITARYRVILVDHMTRREKLASLANKIDITRPQGKRNLERGITKFNSIINDISKVANSLSLNDTKMSGRQ